MVLSVALLAVLLAGNGDAPYMSMINGLLWAMYALENWRLAGELKSSMIRSGERAENADRVLVHTLLLNNMSLHNSTRRLEAEVGRLRRRLTHTDLAFMDDGPEGPRRLVRTDSVFMDCRAESLP